MSTDRNGIGDTAHAVLNDETEGRDPADLDISDLPDAKPADPEVWSPEAVEARVDTYEPNLTDGEGQDIPKGPDPEQWGEQPGGITP